MAVGILAMIFVGIIGYSSLATKSVARSTEMVTAIHVSSALIDWLHRQDFMAVADRIRPAAELPQYDSMPENAPGRNDRAIYATLTGDKIGPGSDPIWIGAARQKYFEIFLIRNQELSPKERDATAAWLVFGIRLRWPVYLPATDSAAQPLVPSRKSELLCAGSISR